MEKQWDVIYKDKKYNVKVKINLEKKNRRIIVNVNNEETIIPIKRNYLLLGIEKEIILKEDDFKFIVCVSSNIIDISIDGTYIDRKIKYKPLCNISYKYNISILSCFAALVFSLNIINCIIFIFAVNKCLKDSRNPYIEEKNKNIMYIAFPTIMWIITIIFRIMKI